MLESAGVAVKTLTTSAGKSGENGIDSVSIEEQKEKFTVASSQYLALLSSIDVGLRRQINALEDAEILPKEAASKDLQSSQVAAMATSNLGGPAPQTRQIAGNRAVITGGGLGSLDVGWLNSRNDRIGKGMEAELWEEAQSFTENLRHEKGRPHDTQGSHPNTGLDGSSSMDQS